MARASAAGPAGTRAVRAHNRPPVRCALARRPCGQCASGGCALKHQAAPLPQGNAERACFWMSSASTTRRIFGSLLASR